jgi:hypothetical protein
MERTLSLTGTTTGASTQEIADIALVEHETVWYRQRGLAFAQETHSPALHPTPTPGHLSGRRCCAPAVGDGDQRNRHCVRTLLPSSVSPVATAAADDGAVGHGLLHITSGADLLSVDPADRRQLAATDRSTGERWPLRRAWVIRTDVRMVDGRARVDGDLMCIYQAQSPALSEQKAIGGVSGDRSLALAPPRPARSWSAHGLPGVTRS